ncbi:L,D-transpeptidase family protein [Plantactinospora sp. KBS50]|uniref:L,D-transpeptidase family protein n=1 Tax=Plantactinospora sp. KBS50 TaxID=2024580 RepID=UPI000BAAF331|nr:L,D-transpeptidase family protein [Plantactinospora sp. KBS50]ASW57130.1 hypothetical protein CIK06_27775 [Plantactinospora sp. KBS50]
MSRLAAPAGVLAALALLAAGCGTAAPDAPGVPGTGTAAPAPSTGTPSDGATGTPSDGSGTPSSAPPSPSDPTGPGSPSASPSGAASPSTGPDLLRVGDSGPEVAAVQRRLRDLGYWLGDPDGEFGPLTQQAVYALQKAAGYTRDGVVGPKTRAALDRGVRPSARSDSGHVAEIDLDRQLLLMVDDGEVKHIFSTSTGTFEHYYHDGQRYLADTPRGHWKVYGQVNAWDPGPLGRLYRPKYFNHQGIAVHGFTSVPPQPASHGCARVTLAAMDWIWSNDQLPIGASVWVY